ncbi:hypothetical protein [Pseudomonas frederiksbergensis]|uniref:hypothetical protein n=1 Tax=Pseudomonas frederiksbergensis TaxID=104087 RepID=UPI001F19F7C1|nr:hypothetical protein [Pseudomonas frederiksbergensis]
MFIDWLKVSQEFEEDLPVISDTAFAAIDTLTGEVMSTRYRAVKHEGSHSSRIHIQIQGRKVTVDGNPSRLNRHDNLWALKRLSSASPFTTNFSLSTACPRLRMHALRDSPRRVRGKKLSSLGRWLLHPSH